MSVDATLVLRPRAGLNSARFDSASPGRDFVVSAPDGSHYRVTGRLLELLECLDGRRTLAQVAEELRGRWQRPVTPQQVWDLSQRYLAPYGLLEGGQERPRESHERRLFGWHRRLLSEQATEPITRLGRHMFSGSAAAVALSLALAAHAAAYARAGTIGVGLAQALGDGTYLLVYALVLLSVLVHEFGHASACRRFGAAYGDIGVGLYLVFPVLYADVTRIWGLTRWRRVVVDLGGVYFQSLVASLYALLYLGTQNMIWLLALAQVNALMLFTLSPLGRFDGYWLICDALGVTRPWRELRRRSGHAGHAEPPPEGGFAPVPRATRIAVWIYSLLVVGSLAYVAVRIGLQAPALAARFTGAVLQSLERAWLAWQAADVVGLAAQLVRLTWPAAMVTGMLLALRRLLVRASGVQRDEVRPDAPAQHLEVEAMNTQARSKTWTSSA